MACSLHLSQIPSLPPVRNEPRFQEPAQTQPARSNCRIEIRRIIYFSFGIESAIMKSNQAIKLWIETKQLNNHAH